MTLFYNVDADPGPDDQPQRSDADIRLNIQKLYADNDYLRDRNIEIHVENGVVTLRGVVFTHQSWQRAADLAADVRGVDEIHNEIKVQPGPGYPA